MAKRESEGAGAKGGSLTALAAALDTRKRPAPVPVPGSLPALRVREQPRPPPAAAVATGAQAASRTAQAVVSGARTSSSDGGRSGAPNVGPRPGAPPQPVTVRDRSPARAHSLAPAPVSRAAAAAGRPDVERPTDEPRRRFPRAPLKVRAELALADDPTRFFEATLPTLNIGVGGMFLESQFSLKVGTRLLIDLVLPSTGRPIRVKGEVLRVDAREDGAAGFAVRFFEYLDGSDVALATHFLAPVVNDFLRAYAAERGLDATPAYLTATTDVISAWELRRAELGGDVWGAAGAAGAA